MSAYFEWMEAHQTEDERLGGRAKVTITLTRIVNQMHSRSCLHGKRMEMSDLPFLDPLPAFLPFSAHSNSEID